MTMNAMIITTGADKSAAWCFLNCSHDEALHMSNADSLELLMKLG